MFEQYILTPFLNSLIQCKDLNAFMLNGGYYTYEDLAKTISKIRDHIQESNDKSQLIGLAVNDDLETYAAIFAIWLEGKAYVPIHPGYPYERRQEIIRDAEISLVIDSSDSSLYYEKNLINSKTLTFKDYNLELTKVDDEELAYILYTSGSTGQPKGVPISRLNLAGFVKAFNQLGIEVTREDRCLQYFDLTFDISIQSYLIPIINGACVYTIAHNRIKPTFAIELMEEHQITFAPTPPSMIRFLRPYFDEIELPYLKTNILCAEASAVQLIDEWKNCIPNARILNLYGPTEATIYCTCSEFYRNAPNKELNGMMTIGQPLNGVKVIVVNENELILPQNERGELCISGDLVTSGYWNNPGKNKISFFLKKIEGKEYRFYRTGDSGFIDEDGDIMLAGRMDDQVKVQGYRIELGEIEAHARDFVSGANAVAYTIVNRSDITEIVLVIEKADYDFHKMEQYLRKKLPFYMIPSKYRIVSEFPLNTNGKVDRKLLKNNLSEC